MAKKTAAKKSTKPKPETVGDYTIQSGVDFPPKRRPSPVRDVVQKMKIGDSVESTDAGRNSFFKNARELGVKLESRSQPDGTYRIWRTA